MSGIAANLVNRPTMISATDDLDQAYKGSHYFRCWNSDLDEAACSKFIGKEKLLNAL
jgi:hypothetical protein